MKQTPQQTFQKWLSEISWGDLQHVMQFDLDKKEQEIFQEMLILQAPPPTPIHPRAIPYVRCQAEASDGRDQAYKRKRDIRYRQRWFRFAKDDQGNIVVQARNFEGDASNRYLQRLTIGSTLEQIEMDRKLQDNTVVVMEQNGHLKCRYMDRVDLSENHGDDHRKAAFLRILKVASRGQLASVYPSTDTAWLEPTKRWFSLAMYLACRFEVSLWNTYRSGRVSAMQETLFPGLQVLPENELWNVVITAVGDIVKANVLLNVEPSRLMDSFIWQLLECPHSYKNNKMKSLVAQNVLNNLQLLSLIEMADIKIFRMKRTICEKLCELSAARVARSLMNDIDITTATPRSQKRNMRKKKKNQQASKSVKKVEDGPDLDQDNEDDLVAASEVTYPPVILFPDNGTTSRQRNRNIIFVLSILEDIMEEVFGHVGLAEDGHSHSTASPTSPTNSPTQSELTVLSSSEGFGCETKATTHMPTAAHVTCLPAEIQEKHLETISQAAVTTWGRDEVILHVDKKIQESNVSQVSAAEKPTSGDNDGAYSHIEPFVPMFESLEDVIDFQNKIDDREQRPPQYAHVAGSSYFFNTSDQNGMVWEVSDAALDDWGRVQGFVPREQSIFSEFFPNHHHIEERGINASNTPPAFTSASSTSQSDRPDIVALASKGNSSIVEDTDHSNEIAIEASDKALLHDRKPQHSSASPSSAVLIRISNKNERLIQSSRSFSSVTASSMPLKTSSMRAKLPTSLSREDLRAPLTPTETSDMKLAVKTKSHAIHHAVGARLTTSRDDHDIQHKRRSADALTSYRLVLVTSSKGKSKDDHDIVSRTTGQLKPVRISSGSPSVQYLVKRRVDVSATTTHREMSPKLPSHVNFKKGRDFHDSCAQSETLKGESEIEHWIDRQPSSMDEGDVDNNTTKDETTTITSAPSHHESEELLRLREERNSYRDMCLTLGAEVAKLTNLLASQRVLSPPPMAGMSYGSYQPNLAEPIFDPESVAHGVLSRQARPMAAMSDAGLRAEHESLASEDTAALVRQGLAVGESDWSVDQASAAIQSTHFQLPSFITRTRGLNDPVSLNGMQSRLAIDILHFVDATNLQLRRQGQLRQNAVERMARLVNMLWPRAQVKLYGSHVTGVCLPSSDVDFIICLPAVHKKAVAVAPGVLEGRNAINESSQKLLYRKLKGEPWIDPRSIKLIERTVVPVIKVSTKDLKARTLQLDITFDAPGHHGLEAVDMVKQIMDELPMIRPLVLVLKQFLINRSLLTAYTGGLSSYCLFLMVARYLQEQPSAYGDVGALLIGFLDFFGNHFDPRTTGLSVRRREYFPRPNYSVSRFQPSAQTATLAAPIWNQTSFLNQTPGIQLNRRNSFSDKGKCDMAIFAPRSAPRTNLLLQNSSPTQSTPQQMYMPDGTPMDNSMFEHRISYNFDPLWVEDPLNESNNVGRNAFRYIQVQRAFSDAHRALVAALEWELPLPSDPESESEYPLLKCLLQSEDLVFDL